MYEEFEELFHLPLTIVLEFQILTPWWRKDVGGNLVVFSKGICN